MNQLHNIILSSFVDNGECQRLFYGRGKKLEGHEHYNVDLYPPVLLITAYKEMSGEQIEWLLEIFSNNQVLKECAVVLQKRYLKTDNTEILKGEPASEIIAIENGLTFHVNPLQPQNIGFFLDMKNGRRWVREQAANKKVLNLFAYTCSLSVAALAGGARDVVNVDMSKASLKMGERNHEINDLDQNRHKAKYVHFDIMKSLGVLTKKGPYDLIIIDPPTYQGGSFNVEKDYIKIIKRLSPMVNEGGLVMSCLNAPFLTSDFIKNLFIENTTDFKLIEVIDSAFSSQEKNLEEGLKILIYQKHA